MQLTSSASKVSRKNIDLALPSATQFYSSAEQQSHHNQRRSLIDDENATLNAEGPDEGSCSLMQSVCTVRLLDDLNDVVGAEPPVVE